MSSSKEATSQPPSAAPTADKASSAPATAGPSPKKDASNTAAGEYLLDRLRILLNRLQATQEILQNWPETRGAETEKTTEKLIASIRKIVLGLRAVERHVNGTGPANQGASESISPEALRAFRTSLETKCPIPLDLLDLMDVNPPPFGLNPQVYARGLMKEAIKQLAGYERRKRALEMLGNALEKGMDEAQEDPASAESSSPKEKGTVNATRKRKSDELDLEDEESKRNKIEKKDIV